MSSKPVVPWVWMRYHDSSSSALQWIQPFMAEATAIFPVFSGAGGIWLWENPTLVNTRTDVYATYEYFVRGLYRLSQFSDMFQGTYERVIETPARDLMDKQLPVWRGIVNGSKILIAAQNPYAADGQQTSLTVRYKTWQQTITLTGREVYLCRHDLSAVTAVEPTLPDVTIYPNPTQTTLTVTFAQPPKTPVDLTLLNTSGQSVVKKTVSSRINQLDVTVLPAGQYLLRIESEVGNQVKKVIIQR